MSILQVKQVKVVAEASSSVVPMDSGPKYTEVGAAGVVVGDDSAAAALPEPALESIHFDSHFDQWKMLGG